MRQIIFILLVIIHISGCQIEKKYHMKGYHIHSLSHNVNKKLFAKNKFQSNEIKDENPSILSKNSINPIKRLDTDVINFQSNSSDNSIVSANRYYTSQIEVSELEKPNFINLNSSLNNRFNNFSIKKSFHDITAKSIKSNEVTKYLGKSQEKKIDKQNDKEKDKKKDKRKKSFSWSYFWFITLSVVLTSFILASPAVASFMLAYLIGFLISISFYWWIRWKRPKLTKSCLFQCIYWVVAPQTFLFLGVLIGGLFSK